MTNFEALGLSPRLLSRLESGGFTTPTPIQNKAIPLVLEGRDLMGLAQTGTGKTAAFGLPLIQMLMKIGKKPEPRSARALILAPTRELAKQICEALQVFVDGSHMKINMVVGGKSINAQTSRLARGTDILVATPGRLLDLIDRRALHLDHTRFLVLDEADQMLDLGFVHALRKISTLLPSERQTLLFSATMSKPMSEIASAYLTDPVRVEAAPPGKVADNIKQSVHYVRQPEKTALLIDLLDKHRDELALVFSRTKHGAEKLKKNLEAAGFAAGSIHGNKSQGQRDRALQAFRAGQIRVLVATDVAARGIDIPDVRHVYNYDLPNVADNYVHRIGRTARAGANGCAVAFCSPTEVGELRAIEKVMKQSIHVAGGKVFEAEKKPASKGRGGRGAKPANAAAMPRNRNRRRRRKAA